MKTAISVPDDLFRRVDARVAELHMNRSEFFSAAADHYLRELDKTSVTEAINAAIERSAAQSHAEQEEFLESGRRHLLEVTADDEW